MILNVQYPPFDAYDTPCEAIAAGQAMHRKCNWFDTKEVEGQTIEAVSYGRWWFALRAGGKRILITPGGTLKAQLDTEPLPPTEPLPEVVTLKYEGVNGPVNHKWRPAEAAQAMLNRRIGPITLHPNWMVICFTRRIEAWFWNLTNMDDHCAMLDWTCDAK